MPHVSRAGEQHESIETEKEGTHHADGQHRLHLSWDHNNNDLNYARSRKSFLTEPPESISAADIEPRQPIAMDAPQRVTHPRFFNDLDETLYSVEIVNVSDPARVRHVSTLKTGEASRAGPATGCCTSATGTRRSCSWPMYATPVTPLTVGEGLLDGYGDRGCRRGKYCFAATPWCYAPIGGAFPWPRVSFRAASSTSRLSLSLDMVELPV